MRNLLFVMFFLLPLIVFGQKKLTSEQKNSLTHKDEVQKFFLNTTQKRKCLYCNGVGKIKDNVTVTCNNCEDWNTEYRKKVACHICKDDRKITRVELVDCWSCQDGVADRTPWDCIEGYNIANKHPRLYRRDIYEYRFEAINIEYNGKETTILMYYKDGTLVWASREDQKPILSGTWKCDGEKGYSTTINGKTSNYVLGKK